MESLTTWPLLSIGTALAGFALSIRTALLDNRLNPHPPKDFFCIFRHVNLWGIKLYHHSIFYYFCVAGLSWNHFPRLLLILSSSFLGFQLYALQKLTRRRELCFACIFFPLTHLVFMAHALSLLP